MKLKDIDEVDEGDGAAQKQDGDGVAESDDNTSQSSDSSADGGLTFVVGCSDDQESPMKNKNDEEDLAEERKDHFDESRRLDDLLINRLKCRR